MVHSIRAAAGQSVASREVWASEKGTPDVNREPRQSPVVETGEEPERFGCPMLMRARPLAHDPSALPSQRCQLGWAVRNNEVANCLAVESPTDCWRVARVNSPAIFTAPERIHETKATAD
jgi:hypothetical protein